MLFTAYRLTICLAVAMLVAFVSGAQAQLSNFTPAEKAQLKSYALDVAKVTRYIAGLNALAMAKRSDPQIAREYEQMENEAATNRLADMRSAYGRHPRIFAFFQRQNLTVDDAVVLPLAVAMAGFATTMPGGQMADTVSPAQLDFVRANGPLMERFMQATSALEGSR
jgi:hypothetical protein